MRLKEGKALHHKSEKVCKQCGRPVGEADYCAYMCMIEKIESLETTLNEARGYIRKLPVSSRVKHIVKLGEILK